ncbi:serine hydrolase domain-containing protein [Mucilaginibacter lappiensis]|uniref:CubicO group peptidase (Beta-lactamase class C family) n=1 Tax=Mucilaginibacter lappiensis TaxID=354630 RepID=A0A841JI30_9SPHI|nr:serine hydrolase domain-containing protein [Mucilaginibacter lappiensis]MBB6128328.1 CubicO group peptidase (beta-lactamase class C family) [Mucilaginibacter lappiensis]
MKTLKCLFLLLLLPCLAGQLYAQNFIVKKQIDRLFKDYARKNSPGYAIGILKGKKVLYARGYGMANLDYQIPITTMSAFDIASVSKQFTGACIALLIMDGKLRLDMPASRFIPELAKYKDTIRIEHLIYNTSGIRDYYQLPRAGGRSWVTFDYFDNAECIRTSLGQDTLAFKPGTKWDYCNVNFMLLARIVEKVSGEPFSTFARRRLFLPLGMNHTLVNDDATAIIPNRVTPYNPRTKEYVDAYRKAGFDVNYGRGWIQHSRNSPHYGGSGINTTVNDLVKWEENFFSQRFGGQPFYDLMHQTRRFQHDRDNQAFGLYRDSFRGRAYWAWDGGDYGVSAQIIRFPKERVAIIVLSNMGNGDAAGKASQIASILTAAKLL